MAAVSIFLLCGDTAPATCNTSNTRIGPSGAEVAAVGIAVVGVIVVGTVVLVHVHNSHHRLKGCVTMGPSGLQLKTDDNKTYALGGEMRDVKAGDTVKIHGNKMKKTKDMTGDQVFTVEKVNKDYGPCTVVPAVKAVGP